jgi:glycosyltransferase involved in cell wall biosynthesis
MASALNGTWSNHSGLLSEELSRLIPSAVHLEPEVTFFPFPPTRVGLARLFEEHHSIPSAASSVHLWAHLWWDRGRRDFSDAHAGWCEPSFIRRSHSTFADIVRPYLLSVSAGTPRAGGEADDPERSTAQQPGDWTYVSMDDYSGYGVAADRCLAALQESGLEVKWAPVLSWGVWNFEPPSVMPAGVVVAHLVPEYLPYVRKWAPDAFLVGHTVWETDRLPDHWLPCLEEADLLIVPSRFNANTFADGPLSTPVAVVPHVAPAIVRGRPEAWEWIPKDVFLFYTIADWDERKAVFKTVEAYLRAFSRRDRVLLVIKTSRDDRRLGPTVGRGVAGKGTTAWSVAQLLAQHRDPPPVRLITRELTNGEIAALHRRGDCYASLCRGEGWGLGAFDAAAYGTPVVTTGFGGHLDYLADSPYLVRFELVPVQDPAGVPSYTPNQRWAEPDVDHGAALLREVAANRGRASTRASAAAEQIVRRYRPAAIAAAFRSAVAQHVDAARAGTGRSCGARHGM